MSKLDHFSCAPASLLAHLRALAAIMVATLGSSGQLLNHKKNTNFVIVMPLCSENTTFERLGCRVGASRAPKMVSKTVRAAEPGDFGRSSARCSVGVMGTAREPPHRSPDLSHVEGQSLSIGLVI